MSTCYCLTCGAEFDPRRAALGYQTCMDCGHEAAIAMRTAWCIATRSSHTNRGRDTA
jgi:DNA-directed RNA polymerase subunit RPC12/RpoP